MRRIIFLLLSTLLVLGAVIGLSSCSASEVKIAIDKASNNEDGDDYSIRIEFDPNGGWLKGRGGVTVIEMYNEDNGDFKIPDPNDESKRGSTGLLKPTRDGYFLAGWYREREEVGTDKNGNPLYRFSGRWDFETDVFKVDPKKNYDPDEAALVLYAAWIPYFDYDIYYVDIDDDGTILSGSEPTFLETVSTTDLLMPDWDISFDSDGKLKNDCTGKMKHVNFPTREGMTFEAAYYDAELSQKIETNVNILDYVDPETGMAKAESIRVYSTWKEGEWYKIYTYSQFSKEFHPDAHFYICDDISFSNKNWNKENVSSDEFTGAIVGFEGQTYTLSGVSVNIKQPQNASAWGLFGQLGSEATIQNICFKNVELKIHTDQKYSGNTYFGLLAGKNLGATLENVKIENGTIHFLNDYNINNLNGLGYYGILFAVGSGEGVETVNLGFDADKCSGAAIYLDSETGMLHVSKQ
ncbi:MAG: hypothetical protein IJW49_00335 [Clostridia bacterium]|nr:hypothetical protein [Clostridia bacterium]